jgi:Fe2+ or Zn2+ uptake regulation protein
MKRRNSHQRNLIYSIIKESTSHPTADEVYLKARMQMPKLSLGTVYRNLGELEADGQIREVRFGAGPSRYDGMLGAHEHFVCTQCGKVSDILPTLTDPALPGKAVTSYKLDYFGLCESCNAK